MKKILIRIVNRVKFNWTMFRLHNSTPGRVLKREARNSDVFGCGSDLLKLIDAKLAPKLLQVERAALSSGTSVIADAIDP